jgi:DNA-binding transcriptional MerR regulator
MIDAGSSTMGQTTGEAGAGMGSVAAGAQQEDVQLDIGSRELLTIGSVVKRLRAEFPDISVSKVRYLEEQQLITPQRTRSGYRLFSHDDYSRLVRVLTMQRDEYLPLKVIRREIERGGGAPVATASRQGPRKADFIEPIGRGHEYTAEEVVQLTGADAALLSELEEYELIRGRQVSGVKRYAELDAAVVSAAVRLSQVGLRPKNLRILKSAVDREFGLVEQVVLPVLSSRRLDHQRDALDLTEEVVQATTQLRQLLLTRSIRRLTSGQSR